MFSMWTGQRRRVIEAAILDKVTAQGKAPSITRQRPFADYMFDAIKRGLDRTQPDYAG